jgi:polyisoprenoid-binding protein YceI
MPLSSGSHQLGPDNATLSVRTGKGGAAAKAGHDLLIEVGDWKATLVVDEDPSKNSIELTVDATSLQVIEGSGGVQALSDDDRANIEETIEDKVLNREEITFSSTSVRGGAAGALAVEGDLTIVGSTEPTSFELTIGEDGALSATVTVTQSDWGMKPYSALFGALKVNDEVVVELEGHV